MAQTPNPYGFKLIYAKESNLSAGLQQFPIASGYKTEDKTFSSDTGVILKGIGSGDPVTFSSDATVSTTTTHLFDGNIGLVTSPWSSSQAALVSATNGGPIPYLPNLAPIVGIFGGCSWQPANQQRQRSEGYVNNTTTVQSQPIQATVNDHPMMVWQVQTNGAFLSAYATSPKTPIGLNFGFTYGLGMDPSTGQSRAQLFVTNTLATNPAGKAPITINTTIVSSTVSATTSYTPAVTSTLHIDVTPNTVTSAVAPTSFTPSSSFTQGTVHTGVEGYFKIIGLVPIQNNNWTDPYVDVYVVINNHYLKPGTPCALQATA